VHREVGDVRLLPPTGWVPVGCGDRRGTNDNATPCTTIPTYVAMTRYPELTFGTGSQIHFSNGYVTGTFSTKGELYLPGQLPSTK
jgi:hypothetical protein